MKQKTAGKLNLPPSKVEFDAIPLKALCSKVSGLFYRIHSSDPKTGKPWGPLHFSTRDTSRFDPAAGVGTLYIAQTFGGAMMEIFDDRWGAIGSLGRSLTQTELREWWVTLVDIPSVSVFDARGGNLSKLGTDAQLLTGDYTASRQWALRMMEHPSEIGGIHYPSRHDPQRTNIALFKRAKVISEHDATLILAHPRSWKRKVGQRGRMVYGPAVQLDSYPDLLSELSRLDVALLP